MGESTAKVPGGVVTVVVAVVVGAREVVVELRRPDPLVMVLSRLREAVSTSPASVPPRINNTVPIRARTTTMAAAYQAKWGTRGDRPPMLEPAPSTGPSAAPG